MRFRVTVRDTHIELRGYIDGEDTLRTVADDMAPTLVIASPSADDYNPFAITDPGNPPTQAKSRELIEAWFEQFHDDKDALLDHLSEVHYKQALVIRGERHRADTVESELMHRELHHFETEGALDQIKGYVKRHMTDDGWTGDPEDIITFLGEKL